MQQQHNNQVRPLPLISILGLVLEGHDTARIASSFDITCADVRAISGGQALSILQRYHHGSEDYAQTMCKVSELSHPALINRVKHLTQVDLLCVLALLTERERLELFEAFAYFRAFCNSPVQFKEFNPWQNTISF